MSSWVRQCKKKHLKIKVFFKLIILKKVKPSPRSKKNITKK